MKKILILFLFFAVSAQAKSVKLGNADISIFAKKRIECSAHYTCGTGLCKNGKCEFCSKVNPCPTDTICILGSCIKDVPCRNNTDCPEGFCDSENAKCVECMVDAHCQSSEQKSRKCVKNKCVNCATTDFECGSCPNAEKPDGSGGCVCADDSFNNSGTCARLCDSTQCASNEIGLYDDKNACCCVACPNGTFPLNGKCVNNCEHTVCLFGTKKITGKACCCS